MEQKRTFTKLSLMSSLCVAAFSAPVFADTSGPDAASACDASMMTGSIAQISETHATVDTSILIDANPSKVWETLTDFDQMSEWSSATLQNITGDIRDGGSVEVTFLFGEDDAGNPVVNRVPHALILREGESIGWSDPFPEDIGGGKDNHHYRIETCGDKTLFVQTDEIIDNPYSLNFVSQLLPLYQLFNAELKVAVEAK